MGQNKFHYNTTSNKHVFSIYLLVIPIKLSLPYSGAGIPVSGAFSVAEVLDQKFSIYGTLASREPHICNPWVYIGATAANVFPAG